MKPERVAWAVGAIGVLAAIFGALLQPERFGFAWLAAATIWFRWPLGCQALLLVHALTGGRWGIPVRPWLLLGVSALPLLLPAIVPIVLLLPRLYPWARPGFGLDNRFYLNVPFAAGRWAFYLIAWFGIGSLTLWRARAGSAIRPLAPAGLILLGLTANFAAIDALMSLDPHFNSSAFGMIFLAESMLFALAVTVFATVLSAPIDTGERNDLGRLLQALLILWAYLDFMQLLIIWQSNLPSEAAWYVVRSTGLWGVAAVLIALAHFLLPFLTLLIPPLRRSPRGLVSVSGLLIVMSVIRGWWLVLPAEGRGVGWIDVAAVLGFAGVSAGLMLRGPVLWLKPSHA